MMQCSFAALEITKPRPLYSAHISIINALMLTEKNVNDELLRKALNKKLQHHIEIVYNSFNYTSCLLLKGYSLYLDGLMGEPKNQNDYFSDAYAHLLHGISGGIENNSFDSIDLEVWHCVIELEKKLNPAIIEILPKKDPPFRHFDSTIFYKLALKEFETQHYMSAIHHIRIATWTLSLQFRLSIPTEQTYQHELNTNPKLIQYRELFMKIYNAKKDHVADPKKDFLNSQNKSKNMLHLKTIALELRKAEMQEKRRLYQLRAPEIKEERLLREKEARIKEEAEQKAKEQEEKELRDKEAQKKAENKRKEKEKLEAKKLHRQEKSKLKAERKRQEKERKRVAEEEQKQETLRVQHEIQKKQTVKLVLSALMENLNRTLDEKENQRKLEELKRVKELEDQQIAQLAEAKRTREAPAKIFQLAFEMSKKLDAKIQTSVLDDAKEDFFSKHLLQNKITDFKKILTNEISEPNSPEGKELKKLFDVLDQLTPIIEFPKTPGFHSIADALDRLETKAGFTKAFAVGGIVRDAQLKRNPFRWKRTFNSTHPNLELDIDLVAGLSTDKSQAFEKLKVAFPEKEGYLVKASELDGLYTISHTKTSAKLFQVMNSRYLCSKSDSAYAKNPLFYDALSRDLLQNAIYADKHGKVYTPLFGTLVAFCCRLIHMINKEPLYRLNGQEFKHSPEIISFLEDPRRLLRALIPLITYVRQIPSGHLKSEFTLTPDLQRSIPEAINLLLPERKESQDFSEEQKLSIRLINIFLGAKVFCRPEAAPILNLFTQFGIMQRLFPGLSESLSNDQTNLILKKECVPEHIYTSFLVCQHAEEFKTLCANHRMQDVAFFNDLNVLIQKLIINKPLFQICFEDQPKKILAVRQAMQKKLGPHKKFVTFHRF